jgi:GNAT superfamily N-acetyltransferase
LSSQPFDEGLVKELPAMLQAANYSAFEALRNGRRVEIRALRPDDRADLIAAVGRSSAQSLYRRFFAVKRDFAEPEIEFFLNVDFVNHVALVAVVGESGRPVIAGGGRYIAVEPRKAEVAFAVVDQYQAQGLGAALMHHLAAIARKAGLKELIATSEMEASKPFHSALMFAALMIGHHFSISAFCWAASASRVCCS